MGVKLQVRWWDGSPVGELVNRGSIFFAYAPEWIERGHNLSPLSLPWDTKIFNGAGGVGGAPGLIADCLPDAWGLKVARRDFLRHQWGTPATMPLLAWRGSRGLGALQFFPALSASVETGKKLEAISASALARGVAKIVRDQPAAVLGQLVRGGTAGGAYPKALVLAYADGTLMVGEPDGAGTPSMVKFDLSATGDAAPCEHAYTLMARAAGIETVTTQLLKDSPRSSRNHLLVGRFDVAPGEPLAKREHFHSLGGLLHREPDDLDYMDLFRAAIRLGCPPATLREIARRMMFNVLVANHDDHGKNHAFIYDEKRRSWRLSPAYDLTYSEGMLACGLTVSGEVWPSYAVMRNLCREAGILPAEFEDIFDRVDESVRRWKEFAKLAGVSKPLTMEITGRMKLIR